MTPTAEFVTGIFVGAIAGAGVSALVVRSGLKKTTETIVERERIWIAKAIAKASVELSHGAIASTAIVLRVFGRKGMDYLADPYEVDRSQGKYYRIHKEGKIR